MPEPTDTPDTAESVQSDREAELPAGLKALLDAPSESIEGFITNDGFVVQLTFPWAVINDVRFALTDAKDAA